MSALAVAVFVGSFAPSPAAAQHDELVIEGVVTDDRGRDILRTDVCVPTLDRHVTTCATVDRSGHFRLTVQDSAGPHELWIRCEVFPRDLMGAFLLEDTIALTAEAPNRLLLTIDLDPCDPREIREERIRVRGYYIAGFEESTLVPCPDDDWFVPSDSLASYRHDARRAWVEFADTIEWNLLGWPVASPTDAYGSTIDYVDWEGVVEGPWSYGHMGVSVFRFTVERVRETLDPRMVACEGLTWAEVATREYW